MRGTRRCAITRRSSMLVMTAMAPPRRGTRPGVIGCRPHRRVKASSSPCYTRRRDEERAMTKHVISTLEAPAAIGPYSQAIRTGDTLWMSGQIPLDPVSMQIVDGGIEAQAERVFGNMQAVLKAAGGTLDDIVKVSIL